MNITVRKTMLPRLICANSAAATRAMVKGTVKKKSSQETLCCKAAR